MKLIQDLGLRQCGKYKKRYAIYECEECSKHFEARCETVKQRNQTMCNNCASKLKRAVIKHGKRKDPINHIINGMIQRCENSNHEYYYCYGTKGIKVCDEWRNDRGAFFKWAEENGYEYGLSIERIDTNKDYCPENCVFIKKSEQALNTSKSIKNRYSEDELDSIVAEYRTSRISMKDLGIKYRMSRPSVKKLLETRQLTQMISDAIGVK